MADVDLSAKQWKAFDALRDNKTTQVLYGGAAGGGKTYLGCQWQLANRLQYPGTRGLIGRSKLKNLRLTTLKTLFAVLSEHELLPETHYTYNAQDSIITFFNGSEIILKDLFAYPSDPNFTSLGSLEITDAFIDEANELTERACSIVESRIRYKLPLPPKILYTCNPSKSWLYGKFYKPYKSGDLPNDVLFIQALVDDNPDSEFVKSYKRQLKKLSRIDRQRLLLGDWEYDDDDTKLFNYDSIIDIFFADYVEPGDTYITADIARKGSDKAVIILWSGWRVESIKTFAVSLTTEIESEIIDMSRDYSVPRSRIIVDEDGVGGGVRDHLRCKGFLNGGRAKRKENYANLKSQCYFKLAEKVNKGQVWIRDDRFKDQIVEELEVIKQKDADKDGKLQIEGKDKIKEILGRSPDYADALMMRVFFDLKSKIHVRV